MAADTLHRIVILPGHLCNRRLYAPLINALGGGAAIQVADLCPYDSIEAMALGALSQAPERFIMLANSMGGAVAFETIRLAQERVQALILMGATARPEFAAQSERRARAVELALAEDWPALTELYAPVFFTVHNRQRDPGLDRTLAAMIGDLGAASIGRQQRAFAVRPDSRPTLRQIACPTLVLCGREDAITPLDHNEEMARHIPGAELKILDDCGHLPTLEQPARTQQLIGDWLDRLASRGWTESERAK